MAIDVREFFRATNPSRTLAADNEEDRKFYIDFSSVRGGQIIEELEQNITFFSPDEPTCELFTGHIGCGKSTELRRLAAELEHEGFHVVYFESSQDLEMGDVDVGDILLAIARRVSESIEELEQFHLEQPRGLQSLLRGAARLLQTEIDLSAEVGVPGFGQVSASTDGSFSAEVGVPGFGQVAASDAEGLSVVALGIGKITAKAKNSPELRSKLREYLEPRTSSLIDAINQELIEPAKEKLKEYGKKGLVAIVDNLDRVESRQKPWGRSQPEYLFVDRGEQLCQLNCHVVYTMPLSLLFSNDLSRLTSRFGVDPKVLPMVPVETRDGSECADGMKRMRQMALARAFPNDSDEARLARIPEIFDRPETLDRLCRISGGHVREFLRLLNDWIKKDRQFPLSADGLEKVIKARRNQMTLAVSDDERQLLDRVKERKRVTGDDGYEVLIRSMFVYEYRDSEGSWFDVNPILESADRLG
ncbi:MAG: AAA family ATPase [Cyanobacteriota bacterium]|nr:AAA family ATPase [Cyanobacteriota bacterium]